MNTNDPQAEYGRPKEPMLSDGEVSKMAQLAMVNCQPDANPMFMHVLGAMDARDFYENLITTGKLRVVVECRVKVDNSPGEWNGMHLFGCNGRGPVTDEVFCPYCGGSIIKPTQQP